MSAVLKALLADPNLAPAFKAAINLDYTPEELAIEAQERAEAEAAREAEHRAERAHELVMERRPISDRDEYPYWTQR